MVSSSSCGCCIHKDVCAFCEKYKDTVQSIDTTVATLQDEIETLKDFDMHVTVLCPHYMLQPNTAIR